MSYASYSSNASSDFVQLNPSSFSHPMAKLFSFDLLTLNLLKQTLAYIFQMVFIAFRSHSTSLNPFSSRPIASECPFRRWHFPSLSLTWDGSNRSSFGLIIPTLSFRFLFEVKLTSLFPLSLSNPLTTSPTLTFQRLFASDTFCAFVELTMWNLYHFKYNDWLSLL